MSISRRSFIETAAMSGLAVCRATGQETDQRTGMPTRLLGKTGARVSILSFGGGNTGWTERYKTEEAGIRALTRALDLGVTYIDTAAVYGDGLSETWIGKATKGRRKGLFIATKVDERNGDAARRTVEASLKRLQSDRLDLVHIHSLKDEDDLKEIEAKGNVLEALCNLKQENVIRFVGITAHTRPAVLRTAIERHDFDCTQVALNAAQAGWGAPGMPGESFEELVVPVANSKNMGILAMKVTARTALYGKAPMDQLLRYPLSLPITAATISMSKLEYIEENVRIVKQFEPLTPIEMRELSGRLASRHKASLDAYFADHADC